MSENKQYENGYYWVKHHGKYKGLIIGKVYGKFIHFPMANWKFKISELKKYNTEILEKVEVPEHLKIKSTVSNSEIYHHEGVESKSNDKKEKFDFNVDVNIEFPDDKTK